MEWKKLGSKVEKVGYKTVIFKDFEQPDGKQAQFTTIGKEGALVAGAIALTEKNQVVIARQYRPGPEKIMDELPGGAVDEGEQPIEAAARELLEETGYASEEPLIPLGAAHRDAYVNETSNYFLALNCKKVSEPNLEEAEHVEVVLISLAELIENAKSGKMTDAIAVFLAYDKLMELQGVSHGKSS